MVFAKKVKRYVYLINNSMTNLCEYGCGTIAAHQLKNKKWCCSKRPAGCAVLKKINSDAQKRAYAALGTTVRYSYADLPDDTKARMSRKGTVYMTVEEVFVDGKEWGSELLRRYLHHYNLKEYKCATAKCGLTEWHGQHITLELDHINGVRSNNSLDNLRWLCPNCHSQTPTFRGYNKSLTGKVKVTDDELLTALQECSNIRTALQSVGLAAKGGNYERAKRLYARMAERSTQGA